MEIIKTISFYPNILHANIRIISGSPNVTSQTSEVGRLLDVCRGVSSVPLQISFLDMFYRSVLVEKKGNKKQGRQRV